MTTSSGTRTVPLLALLLACPRATLTGNEGNTADGASSGGGSSSNSSSSSSSSGGGTTSSASSAGDGNTDTTLGETTGGAFIYEHDGGSVNECDLWEQDCPAGEKCMPCATQYGSTWDALKCMPLDPNPKDVGEPCTMVDGSSSGLDDCEMGAMCWNVDHDTLEGYCIAFCVGSPVAPTCENPCSECYIPGDGLLPLCLPRCDPLAQDCRDGEACYPTFGVFECLEDDSGEEGGAQGDPCEDANHCDPGLFCAEAERVPACDGPAGCCTRFCDVLAPDPACPNADLGAECVPYFEGDYEPSCVFGEIGACLLP